MSGSPARALPSALNEAGSDSYDDDRLCLAVVRENGTEVVMYDASGIPRVFSYQGDTRNLCFSSHGATVADDLLTPCLDEGGNHGEPEENCFCGIDTPHLHAHVYNPMLCGATHVAIDSEKIGFLASQTLLPSAEDAHSQLHIADSESMPSVCNSARVRPALSSADFRRLARVQHDSHEDIIVQHKATGELLLEHPCQDCGSSDVHGRFESAGKRNLNREDCNIEVHFLRAATNAFDVGKVLQSVVDLDSDRTRSLGTLAGTPKRLSEKRCSAALGVVRSTFECDNICCSAEVPVVNDALCQLEGVEKIQINIPLRQVVVDHAGETISAEEIRQVLFDHHLGGKLQRDGGATPNVVSDATSATTKGRSQFAVDKICCAAEIPPIQGIVEPLEGVESVTVNITTKAVFVQHDPHLTAASTIASILSKQGFPATVLVDAAKKGAARAAVHVTSVLSIEHRELETDLLKGFLQSFKSSNQITSFIVNIPESSISVEHNPLSITAQGIADILKEKTGIVAEVTTDGMDADTFYALAQTYEVAASVTQETAEVAVYPRPTVILAGIFWIVSMLSLISGNW